MANAGSIHTVVFVLLLFGVLYFAALGIFELKKWISGKMRDKNKKEDE